MHQNAAAQLDEVVAQFLGLNATDARCLDLVEHLGPMTAGQLATESGLTTGAVTTVVDRLEAAGYAHRVRSSVDRRKVLITASNEAKRLGGAIYAPYRQVWEDAVAGMTDTEVLTVIDFLETAHRIDVEHAAVLRQRFLGRKATLRQRIDEAKKLKNDAKRLLEQVKRDIKHRKDTYVRISEDLENADWELSVWPFARSEQQAEE